MRWILLVSIWASQANARWMTKEEAGAVVDNYVLDYDVAKDGSSVQSVDYSVVVQGEDAKVGSSMFTIDYNSATEKVEILEAYTQNGETKIPVEPTMIEDRDKGKAKDYDAIKVRSVAFPQVQIGSRIRIRYTINTVKPVLKDRWSAQVNLGPGVFMDRVRVTVNSAIPLFVDIEDPGHYASVKQRNKYKIQIDNKKPIPGWVHAEKDPYFHPDRSTRIFISTHKVWPDYFASLQQDVDEVLAKPLPRNLLAWVNSAKNLKEPNAQILYLMEHMSREYHYFGDWRRHEGGVVPRSLAEIEQSRFGDCKDLSALLVAMLRPLGIEANLALVRRGENAWVEEPPYKLPGLSYFNHAIVRARAGGLTFWLDPTNPVSSLEPFSDIAGRPAWILDSKQPMFDRLPPVSTASFLHLHEYEYHFLAADMVKVKVHAWLKKLAPFRMSNDLMLQSRSDVLSDVLEYLSEGHEMSSHRYLKEPSTTRVLKDMDVSLEYVADRVTYDAGKEAFFVMPDGFLSGAFYETGERESDIRLAEDPFTFRGVRRLKDTELKQELPEPCVIRSDWMDLERRIAVEGDDVVIYQNVDLKRPHITRTEFRTPAFKKLQKSTRECFYRSGILIGNRKDDTKSE